MATRTQLTELAQRIRRMILVATTKAGSGHPTSSLSATDLMTVLFFGGFLRYDLRHPKNLNNDRVIFSKGHAAPLLYALYAAAGAIREKDLLRLRKFGSPLEGHPSMAFPFTEAATGSLGQGLSVGVGMALNAKYLNKLSYKTYVLLGDSEMAEGQIWEAIQIASHYKLNNLVGIVDVNRLGQRGSTMYGYNILAYQKRIASFGWNTICVDGHDFNAIAAAFKKTQRATRPCMIIAKTIKGKGVSFLENKNGWHGKTLAPVQLQRALIELGVSNNNPKEIITLPHTKALKKRVAKPAKNVTYHDGEIIATRKAYGSALVRLANKFPSLVVLDAEVGNSTYAEHFAKKYPKRFFEMFIAEQNMVSAATGLAKRGALPAISTFAAFLTRAFDQFRMANYSGVHLIVAGSHAGVSIGEDGSSQMGLEDIAMFRTLQNTIVLYPSDAVSCEKLVEQSFRASGIKYIRTTRKETPVLYKNTEAFPIGGSKILRKGKHDRATIVAAGITVHEALAAYETLQKLRIPVRVIDLYSIKPLDVKTLLTALRETGVILTVEDHVAAGGIGEAVRTACGSASGTIHSLCVGKIPKSGTPEQLLSYEKISREAIAKMCTQIISR